MYIGFVLLILNIVISITLMNYIYHAGIALATSISSWIGILIYFSILIKNGKIFKVSRKLKDKVSNLFLIIKYGSKLIIISFLMVVIMRFVFNILKFYDINEIFALIILVSIGLLVYILTTFVLRFIPQELLDSVVLKFQKVNKT